MSVMPAPRRIDLHALIEEAKRRARQRRLAYAAGLLALSAGGIAVGLALTSGSASPKAPPGFTVVKARGRVDHALIQYSSSVRITSLGGRDRPANTIEEVWYDARGGLWRDIVRVDGRVRSDRAGTCAVAPKEVPCGAIPPLSYLRPFEWPPSSAGLHVTGKGTFRGVPVVWLEPKYGISMPRTKVTEQIGLDPRTHRLVVNRYFSGGRPVGDETVISAQTSLPARSVSFVVRKHARGGAPDSLREPFTGRLLAYGLRAARTALGSTPLWLGPRFHGYVLRSVMTSRYPFGITKTGALRPAPVVRFSYGDEVDEHYWVSVEEFGSIRPYFYRQAPRPGTIERDVMTSIVRLTRGGLLLRITSDPGHFQLTRANAVALARALRPLPPHATVGTLRQQ
jgi:hypothetical protein